MPFILLLALVFIGLCITISSDISQKWERMEREKVKTVTKYEYETIIDGDILYILPLAILE